MSEVEKPAQSNQNIIVILDNRPITLRELEELKAKKDRKIIEVSQGVYKTLTRLQG